MFQRKLQSNRSKYHLRPSVLKEEKSKIHEKRKSSNLKQLILDLEFIREVVAGSGGEVVGARLHTTAELDRPEFKKIQQATPQKTEGCAIKMIQFRINNSSVSVLTNLES